MFHPHHDVQPASSPLPAVIRPHQSTVCLSSAGLAAGDEGGRLGGGGGGGGARGGGAGRDAAGRRHRTAGDPRGPAHHTEHRPNTGRVRRRSVQWNGNVTRGGPNIVLQTIESWNPILNRIPGFNPTES